VEGSSNIIVTNTAKEGEAANYKVELKKDIDVDTVKATTVTTGQTVMNNDGLKVGKDVSVTATAVTAGQTSISNDGLKVNGKTYVSDSGLNANDLKITNVADGKVEKGSTDAVNGGQLYNETRVAKDGKFVKKSNTAGENLSALDNQVTANTESIYHMNGRISDLDNRVNKVGAGAAALAALHPLDFDPDAKWDFAAGYGNYRGANAAAVGAYYRPNEDTMFSVGGTFGNGENMVNAGVSFKLGSGSSHVSTSRVAMAKEIKELRGELEAMKSAMLDANAGKKIDTSKLQLFPDVPQNHWAYEYVAQLAGNGMIEGYPDGNFDGDRPMTRYEFAAILYRAMTKGAVLSDKILSEFSHELEYFTVDTIAKDKAGNPTIQRVRTVKENKNK
ncbi:MAG: YadA-like family protein, partial [Megasphaera elsdenii]|nr:YadA-like family protein [Megasphaera elsdenii]